MNTPNASGSSKGKMHSIVNTFCSRRTEAPNTSHISDSRQEVWATQNNSDSRRKESLHTHNVSGNRGTEVSERQCENTDPRKATAEGSRHTSDTSQQPSAYVDQTSNMKEMIEIMKEMYNEKTKEMLNMMKEMDNKIITLSNTVQSLLPLDSHNRKGNPIQHQEKQENEVLKAKIIKLEARIQDLLAKVMGKHKHSEDINDPSHLSALLEKYEILQLQEWEKVRCSMPCRWTYEEGSRVIRKLFDACEKDIQQRTDNILKVLDLPLGNNTLTKVMMQDIMKLFKQLYYQNTEVYNKIVCEAAIHIQTENERQFLLQCCQIYCLLLLQDPPVKAVWKMNDTTYLEHVDKKDATLWEKISLLWPIMKCGEEIIVKGVVWDQRII